VIHLIPPPADLQRFAVAFADRFRENLPVSGIRFMQGECGMTEYNEFDAQNWDLAEWENVLSIHVGTAYGCRACGNLVMITRGGTGILDLRCCGKPMEKMALPKGGTP